jgi:MauM/NapG family ferredoxin protein
VKLRVSRLFQLTFLALFLLLVVITDYRGKDEITVAVNSFFRADPLVVVTYLLSAKTFTLLLLPGLLLLLFSALLGRFFCGWICPLGTTLDLIGKYIKRTYPLRILKGNLKYYLLVTVLIAALYNMNLAGLLDPLAILLRFVTFSLYPLLGWLAREGWVDLYGLLGDYTDYVRPAYAFLKEYLLPFRTTFYPLAFVSLLLFLGIVLLERFERRNWCRNLCPLGALLGIASRFSFFRRFPKRLCADCKDCRERCPTTFDEETFQKSECILCLDCEKKCRNGRVVFRPAIDFPKAQPFRQGRRVFVTGLVGGLFVSKIFAARTPFVESHLLRPPGAQDETEFLKKCVRCGECMKVCLRSALYPLSLQAGFYGLYTPVIIPRLGYCEYNCNLCGQVCPTGAIPRLPIESKKKAIIGRAVIDRNHCLPYAKSMNCMVCEEHCPIPEKAIRFEETDGTDRNGQHIGLKRPYVLEESCNGCGICEYVCPLEEKAGIEVFRQTKRKL